MLQGRTVKPVTLTVTWDRTDPDQAGFNVYYGDQPLTYTNEINAGPATSLSISNLFPTNHYFFAATSYNVQGRESDFSNEAQWPVPVTNYYWLYCQHATNLTDFVDVSGVPFLILTNVSMSDALSLWRIRIAQSTNSP